MKVERRISRLISGAGRMAPIRPAPLNLTPMEEFMHRDTICRLGNKVLSTLLLGLCVGLIFGLNGKTARAQSTSSGTVSGLVADQQSAVVPGAEVTLTDLGTSASRKTTSNDAGRYTFVNVPPGIYDISVSRTGFQRAVVAGQKVTVGLELTANVTLQAGSVSETVLVTATSGTQLQT